MTYAVSQSLTAGSYVMPIGSVLPFAGNAEDRAVAESLLAEGWMPCFGQSLPSADHQALFNVIGYAFGGSAGTFLLPDLRGQFVRGARTSSGTGMAGVLGEAQAFFTQLPTHHAEAQSGSQLDVAATGAHTHTVSYLPTDNHESYYTAGHQTAEWGGADTKVDAGGAHTHAVTGGGDEETRPLNVYVDFVIKVTEPA